MGIFLQLLKISLLHMDDTDSKKYNLSILGLCLVELIVQVKRHNIPLSHSKP